jgi:hypothetical protein
VLDKEVFQPGQTVALGETFEEQLIREHREYKQARDNGELPVAPICRQQLEPIDAQARGQRVPKAGLSSKSR